MSGSFFPIYMKYSFGLLGLGMLILACQAKPEKQTTLRIPKVFLPDTSAQLSLRDGVLYHGDGLFSGWLYALYPNGDTLSLSPFWQGKLEGWAKTWHKNTRLAEWRFYCQGLREGLHQSWHPNGKPRFSYAFVQDLHHGLKREWYDSGQMATDMQYTMGEETGRQRAWFINGQIRYNYELRNGRIYGLSGVKNCMSVIDTSLGRWTKAP
jgi:hypothetical protein